MGSRSSASHSHSESPFPPPKKNLSAYFPLPILLISHEKKKPALYGKSLPCLSLPFLGVTVARETTVHLPLGRLRNRISTPATTRGAFPGIPPPNITTAAVVRFGAFPVNPVDTELYVIIPMFPRDDERVFQFGSELIWRLVVHRFAEVVLGFANEVLVAIGQLHMSPEILRVAFAGFGLN